MLLLKILFYFLAVYALFLFFAAFTRMRGMIKLAKNKLGKDATDRKAINFMYISGAGLAIAAIIVGLFVFGVF